MKTERELSEREIKTLDKRKKEIAKQHTRLVRFVLIWTATSLVGGIVIAIFIDFNLWLLLSATVLVFIGIGCWTFFQEIGKGQVLIHDHYQLTTKPNP